MKLIVGLGNVGTQYTSTRHNLGFMVIDELAQRHELSFGSKDQALVAKGEIEGESVVLAKPATMMNLSGPAVGQLMRYYKLDPAGVWVVYDELDLEFGKLRVRGQGSSAGHNGIASVIESIGEGFVRWRLGIGRPTGPMDARNYVLQPFSKTEAEKLPQVINQTTDLLEQKLTQDSIEPESFNLL